VITTKRPPKREIELHFHVAGREVSEAVFLAELVKQLKGEAK